MKGVFKYCGIKSCRHYNLYFRCRCEEAVKGRVDLSNCEIRKQTKIINKRKSEKNHRAKNLDWWNGYQRAFHGSFGKPLDLKIAFGYPYGKMVLVKDCPFCHGTHKHKKGERIKFAQCAKGYYKIYMCRTK